MVSSTSLGSSSIIKCVVLAVFIASTLSTSASEGNKTQTLLASKEIQKLRRIRSYLKKINRPYSADGDQIDCVPSHLQPAFDHPNLKGQKPLDPPEFRPKGYEQNNSSDDSEIENFQLWKSSGESCPPGTVPIRRTTEEDVLRVSSLGRFGRKPRRSVRRDSTGSGHEHAVGFINGNQFYGAKASVNVWSPGVTDSYEFSLSQIWVISGSFGNDLNTIEAGWQASISYIIIYTSFILNKVSPALFGDNYPRFFTYWTVSLCSSSFLLLIFIATFFFLHTDAYQTTGCYNLLCSGFVQTNYRVAIGAAISPRSSFGGRQFDISIMDPKHGHWWLQFGNGLLVGYWPAFLFSHLRSQANMIQFGGEIVNSGSSGFHTSTQMGSGHFAEEGFGKAAYFRNLQVVDWDNNLIPPSNLRLLADHPNCYDIKQGKNSAWGDYFYYGGPGRNVKCP
ncbi:hypothetical protein V2J09_006838 [Rumex salicifolius]